MRAVRGGISVLTKRDGMSVRIARNRSTEYDYAAGRREAILIVRTAQRGVHGLLGYANRTRRGPAKRASSVLAREGKQSVGRPKRKMTGPTVAVVASTV